MSQPSAELEKLRAELVKAKDSIIEAHHKLREERRASYDVKVTLRSAEEKLTTCREDLRKTLDMLDAQKVKFAKNQLLLEEARRSAAESQAALSNAEARLEEVRADQKVIYESTIVLQEQVKSSQSELESEWAVLSQAREGSEALQKALDKSLEREAETTRRAELLEVKLDGIPLALSFLLRFTRMLIACCAEIHAGAQRQRDNDHEQIRFLQAEGDKLCVTADLILQKVFSKGVDAGAPSIWQERLKLVPDEVSMRLKGAAASGTMQALALVKSHYNFVDLKRIEDGFTAETDEAKFDQLLSEAEPTAEVLVGFMNIDDLE